MKDEGREEEVIKYELKEERRDKGGVGGEVEKSRR